MEELLHAFEVILCEKCWRGFLEMENKPEFSKRLWKWFNGKYSRNDEAIKRIQNTLFKSSNKLERKTAKKILRLSENIINYCPKEHYRDDYYWGWNDAGIEIQSLIKSRFVEKSKEAELLNEPAVTLHKKVPKFLAKELEKNQKELLKTKFADKCFNCYKEFRECAGGENKMNFCFSITMEQFNFFLISVVWILSIYAGYEIGKYIGEYRERYRRIKSDYEKRGV